MPHVEASRHIPEINEDTYWYKKNADFKKGNFAMKKIPLAIVIIILLVGLAACSKSPATAQSASTPTESEAVETETSEDLTKEPTETTAQWLSYSIYIPNDNANGFITDTIYTEDISAETVLDELKKRNVLPDAVSINSFSIENGLITIDFNQAFSDVVCSMGASGEAMIVGSVVNTFLDAFQAESVFFTVDGQILESGHVIYDFALSFFAIDPQPAN